MQKIQIAGEKPAQLQDRDFSLAQSQNGDSLSLFSILSLGTSVFFSALADWIFLLYLGSTTVMVGPDYSGTGMGSPNIFVPLYVFMISFGALYDWANKNLHKETVPFTSPFDTAKLLRLLVALLFTIGPLRAFCLTEPESANALICLFILSSQWSAFFLLRRAKLFGLINTKVVGLAIASWGAGQALALKLSPAFVNTYTDYYPPLVCAALYTMALVLSYVVQVKLSECATAYGESKGSESSGLKDYFPHGLMVGLMALPVLSLLISTGIFAIEGLQILPVSPGQNGLNLADMCCKLTVAFVLGAAFAPFVETFAVRTNKSRKRFWLFATFLSLSLFTAGAVARDSALSYFSLFTASAIVGTLSVLEETRFLENLAVEHQALTLSLRNAHVLLLSGIVALAVERSIPLVSGLYLLKELNLQAAALSFMALALAPLVIVLGARLKKRQNS